MSVPWMELMMESKSLPAETRPKGLPVFRGVGRICQRFVLLIILMTRQDWGEACGCGA